MEPEQLKKLGEKALRAFVAAFLTIFAAGIVNILVTFSTTFDWHVAKVALVSLVLSALIAGGRAIVALLPIFLADNDVGLKKSP